jgi:hypothetical protein
LSKHFSSDDADLIEKPHDIQAIGIDQKTQQNKNSS